jgi:alginate O-acetyltransferase complex protein AlgI
MRPLFQLIFLFYYSAALGIERFKRARKPLLIFSVLTTCTILFVFKYFNFFNVNLSALAKFLHWDYPIQHLSLILPLGLSFHTFQSLSYVFEVYHGRQKPERNMGMYALYVMFFPQLVAGPIERPQHLLPQFYKNHSFNYERVTDGMKLIFWGLFKKVVIADQLAVYVDLVYSNPTIYHGISLIFATVFFAFQIYCDFSGYTDIAIGSARVMGFELMQNFNVPYFAASIREFWRRWHISLTSWFRDYLYFPLGGNRVSRLRFYFNIMLVFIVSGLWHGASWTFLIWGLLNGFYLLFSHWTKNWREAIVQKIGLIQYPQVYQCLRIVITFSLICFSWIFFRSSGIDEAFYIIKHLFDFGDTRKLLNHMFFPVLLVLIFIFAEAWSRRQGGNVFSAMASLSAFQRWTLYYLFVLSFIFLGDFAKKPFIYFQF